MSLVPYSRGALGKRTRTGRSYGDFLGHPLTQRVARMGMNYAAGKIQNWWRSRNNVGGNPATWTPPARRSDTSRRLFTPTGVQSAGVVPSGSSTRRVSRPNRRHFSLPRGTYRGRARGRKRRFRKRRKGKMMRSLWRMMHCPQELKVTTANYKTSYGYGVRTWMFDTVGSSTDLKNLYNRRPQSLFFAATATTGSATTQTPYGRPHKLHITQFSRKYTLQNRCNWMMHLKVYECLLRRDHNYSAAGGSDNFNVWCIDLLNNAESTFTNLGPIPGTLGGVNENLQQHHQNPMFTPYNSSPFCSMFKILKCTSLQLSPNDYQVYTVRCRRKVFDTQRIDGYTGARDTDGYLEGHGGWSKILVFTWVGGPVDTGNLLNNQQSKAANALTYQVDTDIKYYYELDPYPLRSILSSNAGNLEMSFADTNRYKTLNNITYGIPYTEVVETVPAPATLVNTDDAQAANPVG